jgi:hypothetical protein
LQVAEDRTAIREVFLSARIGLKQDYEFATPEQYLAYWKRFDDLLVEIRHDWISDYMSKAFEALESRIRPDLSDSDFEDALAPYRDDLIDAWAGTEEKPGPLSKIILAGMAAGNEAVERERSMKPTRAITLGIDWNLLNKEALDFVRTYLGGLIKRLDVTTREAARKAIQDWIVSGEPLEALRVAMRGVFTNRARADMIAKTEATRVYTQGAFRRFDDAACAKSNGRLSEMLMYVRFAVRCTIKRQLCRQGWYSAETGQHVTPPAHSRCRCFPKPVLT